MKKTTWYTGHRWTQEQIVGLMAMWQEGKSPRDIAEALGCTGEKGVMSMVVRMRRQGIPLERRRRGHKAGRSNQLWTQAEVEYLIRRRSEKATMEEIANGLGRTWQAVQSMIAKLRLEDVPVPMFGMGVRRLWDANAARITFRELAEA